MPRSLLFASAIAVVSLSGAAHADQLADCLAAHEQSQRHQRDGALGEARQELEACVAEACPQPVREDCARWLDELEAAQPTVVVVVREAGSGAALDGARVLVDGVAVEHAGGRAFPVDPGERRFRVETRDGRSIERAIVVAEGEKTRRIEIEVPPPKRREPPPTTPVEPDGGPPVAVYVLAALGGAGAAAFAVLAGVGFAREGALDDECAPFCEPDEVDEVRRLYIAADVVSAVGLVAGAAAITIAIADASGNETGALRAEVGPRAALFSWSSPW